MADHEHVAILQQGVEVWNQWRKANPHVTPDLSDASIYSCCGDLSGVNLSGAILDGARFLMVKLRGANLSEARLQSASFRHVDLNGANLCAAYLAEACLHRAQLVKADLRLANLMWTNLWKANLSGADLRMANLIGANLWQANLSGADLSEAMLEHAVLVESNMEGAILSGCRIFGISAWNVRLDGAIQSGLVITPQEESEIQLDDLEIAQFIYLLLNNKKIRRVIDESTSKVVLILGRFTPKRKSILNTVKEELRKCGYVPVLFDFDKSGNQTKLETVSTLAHLAGFVIADLTDAKSVLQELQAIVPLCPSVIVQPLLLASQEEPGMFDFFRKFPSVLPPISYENQKTLLAELRKSIIAHAESRARERKAQH
jgi:uncharacterized protein YjbI with pentapeptide repeats